MMLIFFFALAGCSTVPVRSADVVLPTETLQVQDVPFYPQDQYQCGPAALAMLLDWGGKEISLSQVVEQVYSPTLKGSLQPSLITSARRHGHLAYPITGQEALFTELAAGHPVLVLQNLGLSWIPRWHYAVVIGFDINNKNFILHSGEQARTRLDSRIFNRTWARSGYWGLVVLPPQILPASADKTPLLEAILGLERAGQQQAAILAYQAVVDKWPNSFIAWMGLGNNHYLLNDMENAILAYRTASGLQPDNGVPLNNLAAALAATGQWDEALTTIEQAIARGGALQNTFLQTRQEILAAKKDHIRDSETLP